MQKILYDALNCSKPTQLHMPNFPSSIPLPTLPGLKLIHRGKVRDSYQLPKNQRLVVATDRISALDIVLPVLISQKGEILTAMNIFWADKFALAGYRQDIIAYGAAIDRYLPVTLRCNKELQRRAIVVGNAFTLKIECIARGNLTGSGWKDYLATGSVSGHVLTDGLRDGSPIQPTIFTPSTQAEVGHDEPLNAFDVRKKYGENVERYTIALYEAGRDFAHSKGIVIADTKFEFGLGQKNQDPRIDELILIDERLTPDSSRFWPESDWERTLRDNLRKPQNESKAPPSLDKEPVRQFLKDARVKLEQEAWNLDMQSIVEPTLRRYMEAFECLTGFSLEAYQKEVMKVV